MRYAFKYNVILISFILPFSSAFCQKTLTGKITDKESHESLPGVTLYFPDLKTGTVSGADGTYKIEKLPQSKVLIQVSFLGYKTISEMIDLSASAIIDFKMEESIKEISEIVVTGNATGIEKNRTPAPISIVSKSDLLENSSSNIIDAVASQPGVSQVTTGSGISKPVIRGLGYNRIVVVNDGIRQEGQQWGDEHGIEIDEYSVSKVEILKGPASLSYGSDAMAGVINFLSAPTLPEGIVKGNLFLNYQTNNGLFSQAANLAGNKKGFIWDLRASTKDAHAYQNKYDGFVYNSGYSEQTVGGIIGLNRHWGYSHLHASYYELIPGIVEGERDSTTGKFIKPVMINDSMAGTEIATTKDFKSVDPGIPYQHVKHYKAVLNNSFIIKRGSLKSTIGFQQNRRQEFADVLLPNDYGLYFLLNTVNYDVHYLFPEALGYSLSVGVNGMQQTSQNKGTEFLVPEYDLFDIGVFSIIKKSYNRFDFSGGVRYDSRTENTKDLFVNASGEKISSTDPAAIQRFTAFKHEYSGFSGSAGAAYKISETVFTKLNFSRGFRAPSIGEIGANGVHEGTGRYEIGNTNLKPEQSLQIDYALGLNSKHITAELDVFNNSIDNFIYTSKLNSVLGGDSVMDPSDPIPTFKFSQGNANLSGGELMFDLHPHPLDWLHFENAISYVQAMQQNVPDSMKYLPMTPPAKFQSELKANIKKIGSHIQNSFVKAEVNYYFAQKNIYSAFNTETMTPGYTLVDAGIGAELVNKRNKTNPVQLFINVNNIFDVAYQSHLSRLKYEAINYTTGRTGVYNMGRNISFKVIVPFEFSKKKEEDPDKMNIIEINQ